MMERFQIRMTRLCCAVALAALLFSLAACFEKALPPGVVARVNGENIHLRSLQALLDSQSGAMGLAGRASEEEMRKDYVYALGLLIARTLARQELAARHITIDKNEYSSFVEDLKKDFSPDNLEEFMASASIPVESWDKQLKDYFAMEIFKDRVLKPGIKIGLEEIKHYYNTHQDKFRLPASVNLCLLTSPTREALADWCARPNDNSTADVTSQCMDVPETDLPEGVGDPKNLDAGKCSAPKEENGEWRAWLHVKRLPARVVSPIEAYALIEGILLAEKQNEAFEKWLEEKISASSIQVAPALNESLAKIGEKSGLDGRDS